MAIDPRIALGVQVGNIGQAVSQGLATGENIRTRDIRDAILSQQKELGQLSIEQAQQQNALKGIQSLGNLASGLKNVPLADRAKIMAQQAPMLAEMGIPTEQLTTLDLSDNGLNALSASIKPHLGAKLTAGTPANIRTFQYYQSVLTDPNSTEDQKKAAKIALKLEAPTRSFAPKMVDIAGTKYMQVGSELFNPQTGSQVQTDATGLPQGVQEGTEIKPVEALTPEKQLEMEAQRETELITAKETAKLEAKQKVEQVVQQQGQQSKIVDADLAYKALKSGDLGRIYGFGESVYPDFLRSEEGVLLQARRDQLIGMLQLAARGELKGQGTISDSEQKTVASAATILSNESISAEEAEKALDEAMGVLYRNAGMEFNPQSTVESDVDDFLDNLGL